MLVPVSQASAASQGAVDGAVSRRPPRVVRARTESFDGADPFSPSAGEPAPVSPGEIGPSHLASAKASRTTGTESTTCSIPLEWINAWQKKHHRGVAAKLAELEAKLPGLEPKPADITAELELYARKIRQARTDRLPKAEIDDLQKESTPEKAKKRLIDQHTLRKNKLTMALNALARLGNLLALRRGADAVTLLAENFYLISISEKSPIAAPAEKEPS